MNAIPLRQFVETDEDRAERAHEAAREWALEQYAWETGRCEDDRFSAWLIARAQPHMVDWQRYEAALDWQERVEPPRVLTERAWGL